MRNFLVLLVLIGSSLALGGPFITDVAAQAADPPVLWGVDEDDNQLFSIGNYTKIGNGAAAAGFVNHGRLRYDRGNGNIVDLPLVASPGTQTFTGGHIGSMALDSQGIAYMALNAGLEFDDPAANLGAPVLLRFDTANATPAGTLDVVDIVGQINIPGFNEEVNADNISGLSFDPVSGDLYALYRVGSKQFNPGNDQLLIVSPVDATIDPAFGLKVMAGLGQVVRDGEDLEFDTAGNLYVTDDQDDHLYRLNKSTGAIVEVVDNNESGGLTGTGPTKIEALAWDPVLNQMVASATLRQLFFIQRLQNGNNIPLGKLLPELTDAEALDFVIPVAVNPAIDIRKQAEGPDSRTFPSGSEVTFTIVVTNTGDAALTNVTVTDPLATNCNRVIGALAVGASETYSCTAPQVVAGFTNQACVSGTMGDETVEDCDESTVEISNPGIDIRKQAEGPDSRTFPSGSDVTFTIVVTNTGDAALTNVTVTDPLATNCNRVIGALAVGASETYSCTAPQVVAGFTNQACVSGTMGDETVGDCDESTVEIRAIDLEKYTKILAAPTGGDVCKTLGKPKEFTWRYTGDNVLKHSQEAGKVKVKGQLNGESPVNIESEKSNYTAIKKGDDFKTENGKLIIKDPSDPRGKKVLKEIDIHTSCSQPLILGDLYGGVMLVGYTSKEGKHADFNPDVNTDDTDYGEDADDTEGPEGMQGDQVRWTYEVTNTGNVALSKLSVTDDHHDVHPTYVSGDTNDNGLLDTNEIWIYQAEGTVEPGQYANMGTACGEGAGQKVCDDDPSHYHSPVLVADLCEVKGKPQRLVMRYIGGEEEAHSQARGKVTITGSAGPQGDGVEVYIVATDSEDGSGKIFFNGSVPWNGEFIINGSLGLKSQTIVLIKESETGAVVQTVNFHTSCSQPLLPNDKYGAIQLIGG